MNEVAIEVAVTCGCGASFTGKWGWNYTETAQRALDKFWAEHTCTDETEEEGLEPVTPEDDLRVLGGTK